MPTYALSDVTVVSVCYHSDAVIADMINSVPQSTPIILVDNGYTNTFDTVPKGRDIKIISLPSNCGFGRGCNEGAKWATTPLLFFLNPDTRLGEGALDALLAGVRNHPSGSAFSPRISNNNGKAYFKRRSYLLPRAQWMKRGWPTTDREVPVLSGAALLVEKRQFDLINGFDENIFLYHEDDDLSLRLRELGPLFYIRASHVVHSSGRSSARSPKIAYFKARHLAISRVYVGRKHGKLYPALATFLQSLLLLGSPSNIVSKRRRAKALGMLAGAMTMLFQRGGPQP
ncbi:glycosyltransferase [Rhizobium nepotum]|uniref:glycosyltransferase n=1 Tax=Rhizobium nepotum TaxID=1035271 RepID=UPI0006963E76|nr:glycosyltransferase family 2 protein [Rhizobium nepotum]